MTSEIDKLKHFHVENYSGTNFTDDLNDGEVLIIVLLIIYLNVENNGKYL